MYVFFLVLTPASSHPGNSNVGKRRDFGDSRVTSAAAGSSLWACCQDGFGRKTAHDIAFQCCHMHVQALVVALSR